MTATADTAPSLDAESVERYARQIVVPGVGAIGQMRLCAATVAIVGNDHGASAASAYLEAAGLKVCQPPFPHPIDCVVVADESGLGALVALPPTLPEAPIAWYSLRGTTIRCGLRRAKDPSAGGDVACPSETVDDPLHVALHRIGGADAAGMVTSALLGWIAPGEHHEIAFPQLSRSGPGQPRGGVGTVSERS